MVSKLLIPLISNKNICLERYTRIGKSSLIVKDNSMMERLEDIAALLHTKRLELLNALYAYLIYPPPKKTYAK